MKTTFAIQTSCDSKSFCSITKTANYISEQFKSNTILVAHVFKNGNFIACIRNNNQSTQKIYKQISLESYKYDQLKRFEIV